MKNPCTTCIIASVCKKTCKARREWIKNRMEYDLTMKTLRDENKRLEDFIYQRELEDGTILEEVE